MAVFFQKFPTFSPNFCTNLLFSWTRSGRGKSEGKAGASRGDTWRSHSVETRDGAAAWTPTPQTGPEISPGRPHVQCDNRNSTNPPPHPPTEATSHLQVKDVILGVQVDAHGLLLDGHDRQADVDAAVEFSLSQLENQNCVLESPHRSQPTRE